MATILLIIIYIDFIGLGLPDPLFGSAWPAIYPELGLQLSDASYVTLLVSGLTMVSSLLSARIINRFGCKNVTAVSTCLTAVSLFGFSFSGSLWFMFLCALPLGMGAGAIDSGLNNYVALHYKAAHMNYLHCAYGVGVTLSPYIMSLALGSLGWRSGYRWAAAVQTVIAAITVLSIPIWSKAHPEQALPEEEKPKTLPLTQIAKMPKARTVWMMFIFSCAVECTCGIWCSTFMVNSRGCSAETGAVAATLFYGGMTLGRFFAGLLSSKLTPWQLIHLGQGFVLAAIVLLLCFGAPAAAFVALLLLGMGIGPIFPNLNHLTPANFGRDISQSVMGSQMAAAYLGIMVMPALFGALAQKLTTDILPVYLLICFAALMFFTVRMRLLLRREAETV